MEILRWKLNALLPIQTLSLKKYDIDCLFSIEENYFLFQYCVSLLVELHNMSIGFSFELILFIVWEQRTWKSPVRWIRPATIWRPHSAWSRNCRRGSGLRRQKRGRKRALSSRTNSFSAPTRLILNSRICKFLWIVKNLNAFCNLTYSGTFARTSSPNASLDRWRHISMDSGGAQNW